MDVHDKLDELTAMIESARSMPLSASCVVNRTDVLALLDEIRELLPEELAHATRLLSAKDTVVDAGRAEADRVLADARTEADRLVTENEVLRVATEQATRLVEDAKAERDLMRQETDEYVDGKLAGFEQLLEKTLGTVQRGRERLAAVGDQASDRLAGDKLGPREPVG